MFITVRKSNDFLSKYYEKQDIIDVNPEVICYARSSTNKENIGVSEGAAYDLYMQNGKNFLGALLKKSAEEEIKKLHRVSNVSDGRAYYINTKQITDYNIVEATAYRVYFGHPPSLKVFYNDFKSIDSNPEKSLVNFAMTEARRDNKTTSHRDY